MRCPASKTIVSATSNTVQNHYILLSPHGRSEFALGLGMPLCLLRAFIAFLDLLILPCLNSLFPFIRCHFCCCFNSLVLSCSVSYCLRLSSKFQFYFFLGPMSFFRHLSRNLTGEKGSRMLIRWPALETSMGKGRLPPPLGCRKRFSHFPTQMEFSPGLSLLGTLAWTLFGGDSHFIPPPPPPPPSPSAFFPYGSSIHDLYG